MRGVEQHGRWFIPGDTEHQNSGAKLSPQWSSCGGPRVQTQGEQSPVRDKVEPKPEFISVGFSQRKMETDPSKSTTQKGL